MRILLIPLRHMFEWKILGFFFLVPEWNGHLKIFSRPFLIENSRQHLPLRTDILQTVVLSCLSLTANF